MMCPIAAVDALQSTTTNLYQFPIFPCSSEPRGSGPESSGSSTFQEPLLSTVVNGRGIYPLLLQSLECLPQDLSQIELIAYMNIVVAFEAVCILQVKTLT